MMNFMLKLGMKFLEVRISMKILCDKQQQAKCMLNVVNARVFGDRRFSFFLKGPLFQNNIAVFCSAV
jgi:hypothetical protein